MSYIPEQGYPGPCYESPESIRARREREYQSQLFWQRENDRRKAENPRFVTADQSWSRTDPSRS
jgi:hypothetical protein